MHEKVTKKMIVTVTNKYFSPFNSAYRQNYSTQYVLIRLFEEWRKGVGNNFCSGRCFHGLI